MKQVEPKRPRHRLAAADYAQLLKVGYQAVHAANPNSKVLSAGLTYWTDIEGQRPQYFQQLLDELAKDPSRWVVSFGMPMATRLDAVECREILRSRRGQMICEATSPGW